MPKIDKNAAEVRTGTGYPAPFDAPCLDRSFLKLGNAGGLTQFGANLVTLRPGVWASQRHYHTHEDEFVYILSGHPVLIDNDGETLLSPGDACAHPAGDTNGHHMINRTDADVTFLVIGSRNPAQDSCVYPDIDLVAPATGTPNRVFIKKSEA